MVFPWRDGSVNLEVMDLEDQIVGRESWEPIKIKCMPLCMHAGANAFCWALRSVLRKDTKTSKLPFLPTGNSTVHRRKKWSCTQGKT